MTSSEESILINITCPYCKDNFRKQVKYQKQTSLFKIFIKNHSKTKECPPFIAFIDYNGMHRGSQKISNIED